MEDYELLLIGAGLAFYNKRNNGSFAIKRNALEVFLGGHRFALHDISFDLNDKKIDIDAWINGTKPSK